MGVRIEKFIIINNNGTVQFGDNCSDTSATASKTNNGATGPVVADFVNGSRVQNRPANAANNRNL
ncbi:MAG: hypothetical protein ACE3JP_03455 [Ectobacillus sp.]